MTITFSTHEKYYAFMVMKNNKSKFPVQLEILLTLTTDYLHL